MKWKTVKLNGYFLIQKSKLTKFIFYYYGNELPDKLDPKKNLIYQFVMYKTTFWNWQELATKTNVKLANDQKKKIYSFLKEIEKLNLEKNELRLIKFRSSAIVLTEVPYWCTDCMFEGKNKSFLIPTNIKMFKK